MTDDKTRKEHEERTKPQLQLLPRVFCEAVARRLELGARQRGEFNWRRGRPLSAGVYAGKVLRHITAWADGEEQDSEGESHLAAAAADIAIILDAQACGQLVADLPSRVGGAKAKRRFDYVVWYVPELSSSGSAWVAYPHDTVLSVPWMFVGAFQATDVRDAIAQGKAKVAR